ncbi:MAG: polysaccharide biosynthesis/export family protein [Fibrobacter sp.]|nr:polysaccharide biosynthesis/export family protein [Fibrobacter sp.]
MRNFIPFIVLLCVSLFADDDLFSSGVLSSKRGGVSSRSSAVMQPASAESPVDSSYVLGPGDFLDLMLEDNYLSVQVYPDGSVAIEECGGVIVGGKTLAEARELILDLAAKRYKRDQCFVQLSVLKKFKVNAMGAISEVGQQLVEPQTRLSMFLRKVGGTLLSADIEDVQVIRGKDTIHVDYSAMTTKGEFENDIMLEQGDKVYVPFVKMGENVSLIFPGYRTSAAYQEGRTLQEYFDLVGGYRLHNYGYKAACVREPGKAPRWIDISEMSKTTVAPNTEVEFSVQEMLVYVGGAVNYLGRYPYDPSWHAIDYVAASGINTITGTWSQVKVWRGKSPEPLKLSVTEDQIMPGDYIEIPKSHYESFKDFTLFLASLLTVVSSAFIIYVNYK